MRRLLVSPTLLLVWVLLPSLNQSFSQPYKDPPPRPDMMSVKMVTGDAENLDLYDHFNEMPFAIEKVTVTGEVQASIEASSTPLPCSGPAHPRSERRA